MKRMALAFFLGIFMVQPTFAASDKIDPETYICAEFVASNVDGEPPVFEGLQLDGYASGKSGNVIADSMTLRDMLIEVSDSCSAEPTDKALAHWTTARKNHPVVDGTLWRADKALCGDYNDNPDDGSGFVIWLDGYARGKSGKKASILKDQDTFDEFLAACKANPKKLMLDVVTEMAK